MSFPPNPAIEVPERFNLADWLLDARVREELRNSLTQAFGALDIPSPAFTDPANSTGAGGTTIKKVHIDELRRFSASMPDDNPAPGGDEDLPVVTACPAPQTWPGDGATIVANVVACGCVNHTPPAFLSK